MPSSLLRYLTFKILVDLQQIPALNELTLAGVRWGRSWMNHVPNPNTHQNPNPKLLLSPTPDRYAGHYCSAAARDQLYGVRL